MRRAIVYTVSGSTEYYGNGRSEMLCWDDSISWDQLLAEQIGRMDPFQHSHIIEEQTAQMAWERSG